MGNRVYKYICMYVCVCVGRRMRFRIRRPFVCLRHRQTAVAMSMVWRRLRLLRRVAFVPISAASIDQLQFAIHKTHAAHLNTHAYASAKAMRNICYLQR